MLISRCIFHASYRTNWRAIPQRERCAVGPFPPAALASWVNPPHQLVHMACGAVLGRALPSLSLLAPRGSQRAATLCQLHAIAPLLALGKRARAAAAPPAWAPCTCGASRGLQDKADFSCASAHLCLARCNSQQPGSLKYLVVQDLRTCLVSCENIQRGKKSMLIARSNEESKF